eukprot:Sspe_Gene.4990::Locus_1636_Transcript_1_3_Confidence_0.571_Length_1507::g.4990::m.4990
MSAPWGGTGYPDPHIMAPYPMKPGAHFLVPPPFPQPMMCGGPLPCPPTPPPHPPVEFTEPSDGNPHIAFCFVSPGVCCYVKDGDARPPFTFVRVYTVNEETGVFIPQINRVVKLPPDPSVYNRLMHLFALSGVVVTACPPGTYPFPTHPPFPTASSAAYPPYSAPCQPYIMSSSQVMDSAPPPVVEDPIPHCDPDSCHSSDRLSDPVTSTSPTSHQACASLDCPPSPPPSPPQPPQPPCAQPPQPQLSPQTAPPVPQQPPQTTPPPQQPSPPQKPPQADRPGQYACEACDKAFPEVEGLAAHKVEEGHGEWYLCSVGRCKHRFASKDAMLEHARKCVVQNLPLITRERRAGLSR